MVVKKAEQPLSLAEKFQKTLKLKRHTFTLSNIDNTTVILLIAPSIDSLYIIVHKTRLISSTKSAINFCATFV